ncbi:MAG: alpha/beta fold hydrolase [Actinomycetota bacterium]
MSDDPFIDLHPDDQRWGHAHTTGVDGVSIHYVSQGRGEPVILLHGWPGFWYDWRRVIPRVAAEATAIAPDLRGFGGSDAPDLPPEEGYNPVALAGDVVALMDGLGIESAVFAAHDVGATVAQALAMGVPDRVRALVLLNPPYLGIGKRRFEYRFQREAWYQHFHAKPWSHELVGYNRDTVRIYLSHFYDHWLGRKEALRPAELEAIVDVYARPGRVEGGFNYYRARMIQRAGESEVDPAQVAIQTPTIVRWGESDPIIPPEFADRLKEFFPNSSLEMLPGVGHFVPFEAPDDVVVAIREALRR